MDKIKSPLMRIEIWALLLSLITFTFTQWQQAQTLRDQTIVSQREQLQNLVGKLRQDREREDPKFTTDIKTKHYATYMDARLVIQELPPEAITPSQYLVIALESWDIGARGLESIELAKKAAKYSEPESIDQLSSLDALGGYHFLRANLYEENRLEHVEKGKKAYEEMKKSWPAKTKWRIEVIQPKWAKYDKWKKIIASDFGPENGTPEELEVMAFE
jgi:hypothetical protein